MKSYFCRLSYLWILLAVPLAAETSRIYVMNEHGHTVDVIDPVTNKIVQTIEGITEPHGVVFSPDGSRAYITGGSADYSLNVVDTKTGKIIKKAALRSGKLRTPGKAPSAPDKAPSRLNLPAISKDGKRIFICVRDPADAVYVVDTTSLELVKSIPMKDGMHDCYMTPDGKYVVGGSPTGKFLAVIDVQTEQLAWELDFTTGVKPMAIEAGPDGSTRRIFVNLNGLHGFAVVDFATRKEVARILLSDKTSGLLFANPTHGLAIAPDGKTLWVASVGTNEMFVYSLPELKLLGRSPTPKRPPAVGLRPGHHPDAGEPSWVTLTHDGKTAYVCNSDADMVSAIDAKTLKEVARIPVGKSPGRCNTLVMP